MEESRGGEESWNLEDEASLLDAIADCGFGNWTAIGCRMNRKPNDCKFHYESCFIRNPIHDGLPDLPLRNSPCQRKPVPFKPSEQPPRPSPNSHYSLSLAGYWPARGEFALEWDDSALCESDMLAKLSFDHDDDKLTKELKFQAVDVYRRLLQERRYKRRIIRDYGLLVPWKQTVVSAGDKLKLKRSQHIHKCLIPFMRLVPPEEAEKMLQSFFNEMRLRDDIKKLQGYREEGISSLVGAELHDQLLKQRAQEMENERKRPSKEELLLYYVLKQNGIDLEDCDAVTTTLYKNREKPLPHFDITGALGVEKLTSTEKELCCSARVMPDTYLSSKSMMIGECIKRNGLRLLDARKLLKIDVNKTRKMYDYLIHTGDIWQPV